MEGASLAHVHACHAWAMNAAIHELP
jgi:hypothetical protein